MIDEKLDQQNNGRNIILFDVFFGKLFNYNILIISALSKESSGILLLPLSVRPSVRTKSLSLDLRLHFKDLRNDTLGSHLMCLVDAQ